MDGLKKVRQLLNITTEVGPTCLGKVNGGWYWGNGTMGEPIEVREWMTHQIQESWTMDENEANLGREKQNPNFPN
jgi:hypothetical protein